MNSEIYRGSKIDRDRGGGRKKVLREAKVAQLANIYLTYIFTCERTYRALCRGRFVDKIPYIVIKYSDLLPGQSCVQSIAPSPWQRMGVSPQSRLPIMLHT